MLPATHDPPAPPRRPLLEDRVVFALQVLAVAWAWPLLLAVPPWSTPVSAGTLLVAGLVVTPLLVLLLAVLLRARGEGLSALGLAGMQHRGRRALIVGLTAGVVFWWSGCWLTVALTGAGLSVNEGVFAIEGSGQALVASLGAALLGGVCEELLFRGFLLSRLEGLLMDPSSPRRSFWLAALLTSIWFGASHAYQGGAAMVVAGFWGLCLAGLFRLGRRRLVPVMLAHATVDALGLFALAG